MKIVAVIPAYNEGGRIGETILDAARFVDAVVVVDDCSKDTTGVEARAHGAHLLTHLVNCGQGAALQTGMDYALKILRAEIVVHFDADGQMRGEEIPMMVKPIVDGQVDVTLGSRFLGKAENIPLALRWMLKAAVVFTYLTSGLWLSDTHNGFRAFSARAARSIRLRQNRMAHASEILDQIGDKKLSYREIPVTIRYTEASLAKGQKTGALFRIVSDLFKSKFIH